MGTLGFSSLRRLPCWKLEVAGWQPGPVSFPLGLLCHPCRVLGLTATPFQGLGWAYGGREEPDPTPPTVSQVLRRRAGSGSSGTRVRHWCWGHCTPAPPSPSCCRSSVMLALYPFPQAAASSKSSRVSLIASLADGLVLTLH